MSNRKQPGSSRTDPCASPRLASLNFSANPGLILIVTKMAYMSSPSADIYYIRGGLYSLSLELPHGLLGPTWRPHGGLKRLGEGQQLLIGRIQVNLLPEGLTNLVGSSVV